jgi:hypothetical protein
MRREEIARTTSDASARLVNPAPTSGHGEVLSAFSPQRGEKVAEGRNEGPSLRSYFFLPKSRMILMRPSMVFASILPLYAGILPLPSLMALASSSSVAF